VMEHQQLGNFFFDLDQQGAFYDENKNGQRDLKEQEMSDRFTELYYQKLKGLVNEKKVPSSWIFPPLNEQERLAIALQARDYEDQSAHKKLLNTFTDINLLSTKSINQNNQMN